MKLSALLLSACLVSIGLGIRDPRLLLIGSAIFLSLVIADLFLCYRDSKLFRAKALSPSVDETFLSRISRWLDSGISLTGLVLLVITSDKEADTYSIAAWIIWGGTILRWFLCGIIVSVIGGLPLKMGYGGWYVPRPRSNRWRR